MPIGISYPDGATGGGGSTITKVSTADGSIPEVVNGINTNFTIGATPTYATAQVFLGVTLQTSGYSFAASQVVFTSAPTVGMAPVTVKYWS